MSVLNELSQGLADNVENLSPSIVRVEARRRLAASGIVWSADGHIVTASHVVKTDEGIQVGLADGSKVSAKLIGRDNTTDLAILQAEASLTPPAWADMSEVRVGHLVLALGRPQRTVQATLGVVSALGQNWRTPAGGKLSHYLQTDVVMYPGFSGGPLVDVDGAVMGLNTSGLMRGVSVAVPVQSLQSIAEDLVAHGRVRRGYLGVAMQPVRLPKNMPAELDQETGLLLVSVESESPAETGGLLLGDTIVSFAGQPIRHIDELLVLLSGDTIGQSIEVKLVRSGALHTVQVVVGEND